MSRYQIGPVVLMVPDHAGRTVDTTDMTGNRETGTETAAVVAAPAQGVLLESAHHRWDGGGKVVTLSRGDSPPTYDRLLHGARLGVQERGDGTDMVEADLLAWDSSKGAQGWGSPRKSSLDELDRLLGTSAAALLVEAGAYDVGTREELIEDQSRRRTRLCVLFPSGDPVVPLVTYALTRVLPIVRAGGES